jgi:hypothetical protein
MKRTRFRPWVIALAVGLGVATANPAVASATPFRAGAAAGGNTSADLTVRSLAADRGISLSEATRRVTWQQRAPELTARAQQALGRRFGGVWIDTARGDRLQVGVTGTDDARASGEVRTAALAAGVPDAVDAVPVRHSQAELAAAIAWLAAGLERVNAAASWPLAAGLRTDQNAAELRLPANGALTSAQRVLVAAARQRYGDALLVGSYLQRPQPRACAYPYCDPPLRAGIRITNSGAGCTGAFIARSRSDGALYQFTAGHCARFGGTDTWYTHFTDGSTHAIGPVHNYRFSSGGDMAILRIANPSGWNPQAWVYVTAGPDTTLDTSYHITSDSGSTVGQRICTSGAFFGRTDCGTVTRLGVTATYGGVTVTGLGEASFCGIAGDSGAPVYASHTAYGLQTAGFSECDSLYQGIRASEDAMNVNVAHTAA